MESPHHWRRDRRGREDGSRTNLAHALANLALRRNALLALIPVRYPEVRSSRFMEHASTPIAPPACASSADP